MQAIETGKQLGGGRVDFKDPTTKAVIAAVTRPERTLARYRQKGWLCPTQIGKRLCYQLPNVLRFLELIKDENPR